MHMIAKLGMTSELGKMTGLAYLVCIRSETDPVKIKQFKPSQRKIYLDWKKKHTSTIKPDVNQIREMEARHNGFINALKATGKFVDKTK